MAVHDWTSKYLDEKSRLERMDARAAGLCGHIGCDDSESITTVCQQRIGHIGPHGGMGAEWNSSSGLAERRFRRAEAKMKKETDDILKTRDAILKHIAATGEHTGAIACPICGTDKALRFSQAQSNKHIHAKCETAGCVSWME